MKRDSYYRAVKELEDKGYLQETAGGRYIFHEVRAPQEGTGEATAGAAGVLEDLPRAEAEAVREATGAASASSKSGGRGTESAVDFLKSESLAGFAKEQQQKQERNRTDKTQIDTYKRKQEAQQAEAGADREAQRTQ